MNDKPTRPHASGLMDEPPINCYPTLAKELGINKALIMQQLFFLLDVTRRQNTKYNQVDGQWWVYNSYNQWQENYFPWLSIRAIKNHFIELEKAGYVISRQGVKSPTDRRKWYRIDIDAWNNRNSDVVQKAPMHGAKNVSSIMGQKMSHVKTETTTETTKEKRYAPNGDSVKTKSPFGKGVTVFPEAPQPERRVQPEPKPDDTSEPGKETRDGWKDVIATAFFKYGEIPDKGVQWWRVAEWCKVLQTDYPDTTVDDLKLFTEWYSTKNAGCQLHQTRLFATEYAEFRDTDAFKLSRIAPEKREAAQLRAMMGLEI